MLRAYSNRTTRKSNVYITRADPDMPVYSTSTFARARARGVLSKVILLRRIMSSLCVDIHLRVREHWLGHLYTSFCSRKSYPKLEKGRRDLLDIFIYYYYYYYFFKHHTRMGFDPRDYRVAKAVQTRSDGGGSSSSTDFI
jgi:hypothetical protein